MMREWPYTASNRDELSCKSPPTSRFPSALGLRPRDISRASGNLLVVGDVHPSSRQCTYTIFLLTSVVVEDFLTKISYLELFFSGDLGIQCIFQKNRDAV